MSERLQLESFLPYRLNRLTESLSRDFSRIYRERHGLTRPEWRLLATLGQFGTMTATAVGAHSAMHKTKVSRAVSALEAKGWLNRSTDAQDRRVERLSLNARGTTAYRDMVPLAEQFQAQIEAGFDPDEREALARALTALERVTGGRKEKP